MSDIELVKKMLRAVLQSNKNGVSVTSLQSDYRALTGEFIQHRQMGYPALEGFLRSIPSVVRMEQNHFGEGMCFAAPCQETAHIAQLIARQRAPKKTGRAKMVNCYMRVKSASPFMLHAKPRTSLRQPEYMSQTGRGGMSNPGNYGRGGMSNPGNYSCGGMSNPGNYGHGGMSNPGNYGRGGMSNPGNYGIQRQFFTNNQPSVTSFRPNSQTERPRLALSSRFQREVCVTKNTHQSSGAPAPLVKELTAAQVPHIQGLLKQLLLLLLFLQRHHGSE